MGLIANEGPARGVGAARKARHGKTNEVRRACRPRRGRREALLARYRLGLSRGGDSSAVARSRPRDWPG